MGNAKSTIELNGKQYDARTGRIISDDSGEAVNASPQQTNGSAIDGFSKRKSRPASPAVSVNRKLDKSKTLMRPAVNKPVIKNDITTKRPIQEDVGTKSRELRAKHTQKSPLVKRFNHDAIQSTVTKKQTHLPVASQSRAQAKTASHNVAQATRSIPKAQQNVFEQAIHGASSHLEEFESSVGKKRGMLHRSGLRNKTANLAMLSVSGLLLLGFFAYQNAPAVEMRVASTRAGINASMPSYKPSGYGVSNVKSESGGVSVSFRSRTDDKGFTLTQKASDWNSSSLLANTVAQNNQPYQTYQDEGKTVYIYNNSNATWVDGGIWYQVEGNASLTSDQLLRIANSL